VGHCLFNASSRNLRNTRPADAKAILGESALRNLSRMSTAVAVLYVEDDAVIRELVEINLQESGFDVVSTPDGTTALDALKANVVPFRALITDINIGDELDGWEIARRARDFNNTLPVIYLSGRSGNEWQSKGVPNSIMIAKPFTIAQIVNAISTLLDKIRPKHMNY
jgi:DNA-binding response OmpR family regulator